MLKNYYISIGRAYQNESFIDGGIINVIDPTDKELRLLSDRYGINVRKLRAATDTEEPAMWERDDNCTYLIIDVPYKDDDGNYGTVAMMVIDCPKTIVTVCEKSTGIMEKFLNRYSKYLSMEDRIGFQVRLIYAIIKEYQQVLKDIDSKRKAVEKRIKDKLDSEEITTLHELENSLVYILTSLRGFSSVLELLRRDPAVKMDKLNTEIFHTARIENRQSIEMANVYKEIMSNSRDLLSVRVNLSMNKTMQVLAVFTVLLTVPMVVTGAYGMNVDLPLQEDHYAFDVIFWFTLVLVSSLLIWFRKKHIV